MRLLLGFLFGLILGGLLAVALATQSASRTLDDRQIFGGDESSTPHAAHA